MRPDYGSPAGAPGTVLAADGKAVLKRFRVDAVVYAPGEAEAQRLVELADVYFDYAALRPEEGD